MSIKLPISVFLLSTTLAVAGEQFAPPEAHPLKHFDVIWKKNPFTLKTAPAAIQKESFAKDLVLGSMVQFGKETIVVVVNTKTRERTELVTGEAAANGMKIKSANLQETRQDSSVEIEKGGEVAVLHYDESFLKQLAASNAAAEQKRPVAASRPATNDQPAHAAVAATTLSDDQRAALRSTRRRTTAPSSD